MRKFLILAALLAGCGGGSSDEGAGAPTTAPPQPQQPQQPAGPEPFDEGVLSRYEITIDPADWDAIVANPFDETPRRCAVEWQGERYADVAIIPSGGRSRGAGREKPHFRLKFDEFIPKREFHKYSSLAFDNLWVEASMMHARLQYQIYNAFGVPSPRYVHARLSVNGVPKGLYGVEERLGREFARKRYGEPVNQMYTWTKAGLDLVWTGPEPDRYVPGVLVPRIEDLPDDAASVRDMVDILNHRPDQAGTVLDIENILRYIAVETLLGETDSYVAQFQGTASFNNNFYKVPATGLYRFVPWDQDEGFWREPTSITHAFENRILTRVLILERPGGMDQYKTLLRELIAGPGSAAELRRRLEAIVAQIDAAAREDTLKPYPESDRVWVLNHMRSYIDARVAAFAAQLQ